MRRLLFSLSAVALVCGFIAPPNAAAQQSLNFYIGAFTPRPLNARNAGDELAAQSNNIPFDLSTFNQASGIDVSQFNNVTVGGEWLVGLGHNFEGGLGLGFYQRSVPTAYTEYTNPDGSNITQTVQLRIVPFTATFRFLPFGLDQPIQPYIGAGVGVFGWRYSETGQFLDAQLNVSNGNRVGSGAAAGPVILGGVRVPFGRVGAAFEIRYQSAEGTLPTDQGFVGTKIDLGGFNYLFLINVKF